MVDSGHGVVEFLCRQPQVACQLLGGDGDAVAEPVGLDLAEFGQSPHVDRHRVGVVEQDCVGALLVHGPADFDEGRHGAQAPHDAADSDGVGDGLLEPVLFWQVEVQHGCGFKTADLEHRDHIVRTVEDSLQVGVGGDLRFGAVAGDCTRRGWFRGRSNGD